MKRIKNRIYNLIRDDDVNNWKSNIFDGFIILLILVNVVIVIAGTFKISTKCFAIFNTIETISIVIFTIEYIVRVWTSDLIYSDKKPVAARITYIFSFMALIDLIAILPFYIPFLIPVDLRVLRTFRVIRLFRLFKLNRYTSALSTIGEVLKNKASQLLSSMFVVSLLMVITSVIMYNFENQAQPGTFKNAFSGMWWAIATLTTVGYGDIYPVTVAGKVLSAVIALLGIGLVAVPTGLISAGFVEKIENKNNEKSDDKKYCPYCGHQIDK